MMLRNVPVRCHRRADFQLHAWPDGAVVHDGASGDIHALSPVAGELLHWILKAGQSTPERLAQDLLGEPPTESDVCGVHKLLLEFESLGFVELCGA